MPAGTTRARHTSAIGAALVLGFCASPAGGSDLGGWPLCEASAALMVPCAPGHDAHCLLVGDNEVRDALFLFSLDRSGLPDPTSRKPIALRNALAGAKGREISDIEALAQRSRGEILVFGSHSRNRICKRKTRRRVIAGILLAETSAGPGPSGVTRAPASKDLAETIPTSASGVLGEVRDRIRSAELAADRGSCEGAFNLEGAVVLPAPEGDDAGSLREEIWVGLRSPQLDGEALLLRMDASADVLQFDEARTLDLGGLGIRSLALDRGWIFGVSGGELGNDRLWRFPMTELRRSRSGPIAVDVVAAVPNHTEGIAFSPAGILTVSDGENRDGRCVRPASFSLVPWPAGMSPSASPQESP